MPVNYSPPSRDELLAVDGIELGFAQAGIRKPNRKDLLVMHLCEGGTVAGVWTTNRFCAAPVQLCKKHLSTGLSARALVINTGCANAGTGARGLSDAQQTCQWVAQALECQPEQVLPFSTGVILEHLPMRQIEMGVQQACSSLRGADWLDAAESIMTTDTVPKACSRRVSVAGETITITGISKGAGMIKPNMATMLGFIACDAGIAQDVLQSMLSEVAQVSFNSITVDGDTSTNDYKPWVLCPSS